MTNENKYVDLTSLKAFKNNYDIFLIDKLSQKIDFYQGIENVGKTFEVDDNGNITLVLKDDAFQIDAELNSSSTYPVQNKIITQEINNIKSTIDDIEILLESI